jgi:hypothetical protein
VEIEVQKKNSSKWAQEARYIGVGIGDIHSTQGAQKLQTYMLDLIGQKQKFFTRLKDLCLRRASAATNTGGGARLDANEQSRAYSRVRRHD